MNSGLVLLLLGILAIGVSASPYPSSDWYKDRVARARKFPPAPYSDVTAWNVSGTPRNTMIWTYFHDGDVNGTIAQFVKHPQSITTFSVIAYVCEVDGTFQCMYDQNNKPKGCDFYEPGIRQLQQLLPHAAHMPTISLPPGYIGTGLDLLLASEQLQANFIATALVKALTNNYTGYSIDWEAGSDPQLLDAFLTKFKNVLNLKNLTLGYAAVGVDSSLPVNVIQDMGTYGLSGGDLQQTVQNNLAAVGPERYCWGVSADMQTQVSSDFQNMKQLGVVNVCVWDDEIGMMSDDMWQSLADFAQ